MLLGVVVSRFTAILPYDHQANWKRSQNGRLPGRPLTRPGDLSGSTGTGRGIERWQHLASWRRRQDFLPGSPGWTAQSAGVGFRRATSYTGA